MKINREVITNQGQTLVNQALNSTNKIEFTKIEFGATAQSTTNPTSIASVSYTVTDFEVTRKGSVVEIYTRLDSAELQQEVPVREIGLFIKVGSQEALYMYVQYADRIRLDPRNPSAVYVTLTTNITAGENIDLTIESSVKGPAGNDGVGISSVSNLGTDRAIIRLTDGTSNTINLPPGPKGESFTYADLTEEQRLEIRGAEIDTSGFVSRTELNEAIENVDVSDQLASKADIGHTHEIGDVNGLQVNLDGKADVNHTHSEYVTADEVAGLVPDVDLSNYYTKAENDYLFVGLVDSFLADILDLQSSLSNKANVDHTHSISDISNLQSQLDSKSNTDHTHSISDISNLQSQLNLKASSTHLHDSRYSKIGHTHNEYALKSEVPKIKQVTQSEYDRLSSKDSNTLYVVVG